MKNNVFVVNGMARAGKDTFVQLCAKNSNCTVVNISTIDPVKESAKMIGWLGEKTEKARKMLSGLKQVMTNYNDACFNYVKENVNKDSNTLYFIHCREINEIERLVKEFDAKTILIKNNRVPIIESNDSDKNVENYEYDYIIENNDNMEEFTESAKLFLKSIDS